MPTWGQILEELQQVQKSTGTSPFDSVRRKYLSALNLKSNRDVILYATKWGVPGVTPADTSIVEEDIQGFMEVIHGLSGSGLDLILHSPGGSPDVTEALVSYIRTKFSDVRVIVPQSAMSAATMLACSANSIVMGKHSFLGPIDPQFIMQTENGILPIPAQAILDQFDKARIECQEPKNLGHWIPILKQYGPALLVQAENAIKLSRALVAEWLENFMFRGEPDAKQAATKIAEYLSDHKEFKSHGKHLSRDKVKGIGIKVEDLEKDQDVQDLVLSVFHATTHTFAGTQAIKIIENHQGKAFVKIQQSVQVALPNRPASPK